MVMKKCPAEEGADYTAKIRGQWYFARRMAKQELIEPTPPSLEEAYEHELSTYPVGCCPKRNFRMLRRFKRFLYGWLSESRESGYEPIIKNLRRITCYICSGDFWINEIYRKKKGVKHKQGISCPYCHSHLISRILGQKEKEK